jgi:putative acetyltransferase
MEYYLRSEKESDYLGIDEVNERAFGQTNEGALIRKLRSTPKFIPELSLIAEAQGQIVGHILFFPIEIRGDSGIFSSLALAPMSVLPEFQKQGIGSRLVQEGLKRAARLGFTSVIVLGHAEYYPRFGFLKASRWGIQAPFKVPDEVFMALELVPDGLRDVRGTVVYPAELNDG